MALIQHVGNFLFYLNNPTYIRYRSVGFEPTRYLAFQSPWLQQLNIGTVFDIGASIGQTGLLLRLAFPKALMYSFEPLPDEHSRLAALAEKFPKWKTFNVALGEQSGRVTFERSAYSPSSSLLPMADMHRQHFPHTARTTRVEVNVEPLDSLLPECPTEGEILIKLDVQGFEQQVIRGGQALFKQAKLVVLETSFAPLYQGQPLFADLYTQMSDLGYQYAGSFDQLASPLNGRILQQDAIFLRP